MALSANSPITREEGIKTKYPLLAAAKPYEGSLVGLDPTTGYARALAAGDIFVGIADDTYDNTSGANAAKDVLVYSGRQRLKVTLSGVTITDVGSPVFAIDDATLTLQQGTGTYVGWVDRYVTTNTAVVCFDPLASYRHDLQNTILFEDDFFDLVSTGARWAIADTSIAGAPTYQIVTSQHGGVFQAQLAANDEVENVCLYKSDVLSFNLAYVDWMEMRIAANGVTTAHTAVWGVGSARNDTPDSVASNAWFRLEASMALLVESDDGTTDSDDKATGVTLVNDVFKTVAIDFRTLASVKFYVDGVRVDTATTHNIANATYVQPLLQLQKASGTAQPKQYIDYVRIRGRRV